MRKKTERKKTDIFNRDENQCSVCLRTSDYGLSEVSDLDLPGSDLEEAVKEAETPDRNRKRKRSESMEEKEETNYFFLLPFELRVMILSYLSVVDLSRYAHVCKTAYADFCDNFFWNSRLAESFKTTKPGEARQIFVDNFVGNPTALLFREDKEIHFKKAINNRIRGSSLTELQEMCLQSERVKNLLVKGEMSIDEVILKSSPEKTERFNEKQRDQIKQGIFPTDNTNQPVGHCGM